MAPDLTRNAQRANAQRRTGVAYSEAFLRHDTGPGHPERAERLRAIVGRLKEARLWERLEVWDPSPCDDATLELIHTPAHVAAMRQLTAAGGGHIDADTVVSAGSWEAALRAPGTGEKGGRVPGRALRSTCRCRRARATTCTPPPWTRSSSRRCGGSRPSSSWCRWGSTPSGPILSRRCGCRSAARTRRCCARRASSRGRCAMGAW